MQRFYVSLKTKSVNLLTSNEYKVVSISGRAFISKLGLVPLIVTDATRVSNSPLWSLCFNLPYTAPHCTARYVEYEPRTETCGHLMFKFLVLFSSTCQNTRYNTTPCTSAHCSAFISYMASYRVYGAGPNYGMAPGLLYNLALKPGFYCTTAFLIFCFMPHMQITTKLQAMTAGTIVSAWIYLHNTPMQITTGHLKERTESMGMGSAQHW
jgi:hypothetical protein